MRFVVVRESAGQVIAAGVGGQLPSRAAKVENESAGRGWRIRTRSGCPTIARVDYAFYAPQEIWPGSQILSTDQLCMDSRES